MPGVEVRSDKHYFVICLEEGKEIRWGRLPSSTKDQTSEVRMPTEEEWILIGANIEEINKCLEEMHGVKISTDEDYWTFYWTCEEKVTSGHTFPIVYDTLSNDTVLGSYNDENLYRLIRVIY